MFFFYGHLFISWVSFYFLLFFILQRRADRCGGVGATKYKRSETIGSCDGYVRTMTTSTTTMATTQSGNNITEHITSDVQSSKGPSTYLVPAQMVAEGVCPESSGLVENVQQTESKKVDGSLCIFRRLILFEKFERVRIRPSSSW